MTLQLAVKITADASGVRPAANDTRRAFAEVNAELQATDRSARRTQEQLERTAATARRAAIEASVGVRDDFQSARRAADIEAYGRAMDDLRAKHSPLYAAQRQYVAQLAEIRSAHRLGALSADEQTAAINRTKTAFAAQVAAQRFQVSGGRSGQLEPWRRTQLMSQGFDVFASAASGAPPWLIAAQQGPQIIEAYGGVRQALTGIVRVFNPVTIGIAAVTAALAAGGLAWQGYLSSAKGVEAALSGAGRSAGATAGQMEAMARSSAELAGLSVSSARSMQTEFLRTGRIAGSVFDDLIGISKDFAATIGVDVEAAGAKLAELFADPARGAAQLQQMGLLDGATARLVKRLSEQNEVTRAQAVLLNGITPRLADAAEATTALGRAADWAGRQWSDFWDNLGRGLDETFGGGTLEARLEAARHKLIELGQTNRMGWRTGSAAEISAQQDLIADLQEQIRQQQRLAAQREQAARIDRSGALAVEGAGRSPANSDSIRRRDLKGDLDRARNGLDALEAGTPEHELVARDVDARSRALATLMPSLEKQIQLDQLDLQIQMARGPVERANLVARRERLSLAGEEVTSAEAERRIEAARSRALHEGLSQSRQRLTDMQDETGARARVNAAVAAGTLSLAEGERQLRMEAELRPLIRDALKAEGEERQRLIELIDQTRQAYASAGSTESRSAALSILRDQRDQVDQLRLEISLIGQSEQVRARRLAQLEAEQRISSYGISRNSLEANAIREQAQALADLSVQQQRAQDAWNRYQQAGEGALDALGDMLAGQSVEWTDVIQDIGRELIQLSIINPLKNGLLGTNYGTWGDLTKGLSGSNDNRPGLASALGATAANPMFVSIVGGAAGLLGASAAGNTATGTAAASTANTAGATGLNASFSSSLDKMIADAKAAGHEISINSGYRSIERQQQLWDQALAKYGSPELARQWVAPPGKSMHNSGLAADLGYGSDAARSWAHSNASAYGLNFPLSNENWHVEPQGARSGAFAGLETQAQSFSTSLSTATQGVSQFSTGITDVSRTVVESTGNITVSAGQLSQASQTVATSATSFTGGLGGAFEQILGGLGQIGSGFLQGFGGILETLLGGLGGSGGGSLITGIAGLFGFADGGIMTARGAVPLRAYSAGGVATSPQLALYGEGSKPEAYVPLPDGRRIPVAMSISSQVAAGGEGSAFAAAAAMNRAADRLSTGGARPAGKIEVHNHNAPGEPQVEQTTDAEGNTRIDQVWDRQTAKVAARRNSQTRQVLDVTRGAIRR